MPYLGVPSFIGSTTERFEDSSFHITITCPTVQSIFPKPINHKYITRHSIENFANDHRLCSRRHISEEALSTQGFWRCRKQHGTCVLNNPEKWQRCCSSIFHYFVIFEYCDAVERPSEYMSAVVPNRRELFPNRSSLGCSAWSGNAAKGVIAPFLNDSGERVSYSRPSKDYHTDDVHWPPILEAISRIRSGRVRSAPIWHVDFVARLADCLDSHMKYHTTPLHHHGWLVVPAAVCTVKRQLSSLCPRRINGCHTKRRGARLLLLYQSSSRWITTINPWQWYRYSMGML